MVATLIPAAIAVIGTLLGAIVSGRFQERAAQRAARAQQDAAERSAELARREESRRERLAAVRDVATAISAHRSVMWNRGDAVLKEAPAERVQALREETRTTRRAVTGPLVALRILIEDEAVRAAADHMISATYAIRETYRIGPAADDQAREAAKAALTAARQAAAAAHDDFVDAAARYLRVF